MHASMIRSFLNKSRRVPRGTTNGTPCAGGSRGSFALIREAPTALVALVVAMLILAISSRPCDALVCCSPSGACTVVSSICSGNTFPVGGGTCSPNPCSGVCCNITTGACSIVGGSPAGSSLCSSPNTYTYQATSSSCTPNPCPPAGNTCAFAVTIATGSAAFSTTSATTDGPNPQPECDPSFPNFLNDIWYRYVPVQSGALTASTCNQATFDTKVGVYTGACGSLTLIGCSEDAPGCAGFTSAVQVAVTAGQAVLVRIGSYDQLSGSGTLTLSQINSGRCCAADGACTFVAASLCAGVAGAEGSVCSPNPCPQPMGACCEVGGTCTLVSRPSCAGIYRGDSTTCGTQNCAADLAYLDFTSAILSREILRWEYSLNPNPRMYAVLAALRRVATLNPNAKLAQLNQFATAYDQMLSTAYLGDPQLFFGANLITAVRFPAAPVSTAGMNLEVGAEVLTDLDLDPSGPPYGDRTWQLSWFQSVQDRSLVDSATMGDVLLSEFRGIDADGAYNPALKAAALAFVRTQLRSVPALGNINPTPSATELHASYPAIETAFSLLPPNAAQYAADAAGGFAALNALTTGEFTVVQSFLAAKRTEIISILTTQNPTLESSIVAASTQTAVTAALGARLADQIQVATSRARMGMFIETIRNQTPVMQRTVVEQRLHTAAAHTQTADWMTNTKSVVQGLFAIAGGAKSIYESKGMSAASAGGDIYGGLQQVLGVFGVDVDIPILGPLLSPTVSKPPVDNTVRNLVLQLQAQMESLRSTMDARFDKVDKNLSDIYSTMLNQFAAQNLQNQYTYEQLQGIQQTLSIQSSNMARFEQDLFGVLDNFLNHFLLVDLNTALDFQRRNQSDLPFTGGGSFATYEGSLFTWATENAADATRAGTTSTLTYDATALTPLMFTNPVQPIGFRINGLRTMATQIPGSPALPSLGATAVVNPTTWAVNADTYGYFARQNPWYTLRVLSNAPARLSSVISKGADVQMVMNNARSSQLFTRLIADYKSKLTSLKTPLDAIDAQVLQPYPGIDIFGAVDQPVAKALLDNTASDTGNRNYPAALMAQYNAICNGTVYDSSIGGFTYRCPDLHQCDFEGGNCPRNTPLSSPNPSRVQGVGNLDAWGWDAAHVFLPPEYKVAAALKLDGPTAGSRGRDLSNYAFCWRLSGTNGYNTSSQNWTTNSNGLVTGSIDVELWWNPNDNANYAATSNNGGPALKPFYIPGDGRGMTLIVTRRFSFTMRANDQCGFNFEPRYAFSNRWDTVYEGCLDCNCSGVTTIFDHFFDAQSSDSVTGMPGTRVWTATTIVNQAALDQVRAEIRQKFKSLQFDIYNRYAAALADASNNLTVKNAADLATVPVKAIDAYAALGIPESLRRSELLRGILRGNELGLDRTAMYDYYTKIANGIGAATTPLTARPQYFWNGSNPSIALTRCNYLQQELTAILNANRPEQCPMMQWSLANLNHLGNNIGKVARDDRYVMRRASTPLVVQAPGVLGNDTPAPRPAGQNANLSAELFTLPSQGTVTLNANGGFTYTPPSPLPPNLTSVTFQYKAKANLSPPSTNPLDFETSDPVTVLIDIGDDCVPTILAQPQPSSLVVNGVASFSVAAGANGRVSYRWYRNGVPLVDSQFGACCAGSDGCWLVGQADCSHIGGNWFGAGTACGGVQVCYSCPLPVCPPADLDTKISGAATPLLTVINLHAADRGNYTCIVSSSCASVTTANAALGSCAADFNGSGTPEVQDIFDFLGAWFSGSLSADFNGSGMLQVQDIFDFLGAWFAGC